MAGNGSQIVECFRKKKPEKRTNSTFQSNQGRLQGGGSHYPETDLQNEERKSDLQQGERPGQRLRALESTRPVT